MIFFAYIIFLLLKWFLFLLLSVKKKTNEIDKWSGNLLLQKQVQRKSLFDEHWRPGRNDICDNFVFVKGKKAICHLWILQKNPLKMTIFFPRCSNFVYSFSQSSLPFFTIFFKESEDRQFKLHALIKFFWFLIITTAFNREGQSCHEQNVKYISVISRILPIK